MQYKEKKIMINADHELQKKLEFIAHKTQKNRSIVIQRAIETYYLFCTYGKDVAIRFMQD